MISIAPAEAEFLQAVFDIAIEVGWTHQVEQIIASSIPNEVDIEQVAFSTEEISEAWEKSEAVFNKENDIQEKNNQVKNIGAFANFNPIQTELGQNQINDRFGSGQGHGHVGEQAGDVFDKLQLRDAQKLGASHEKHGADRVVNNENIQTKFGRTSGKTIGQFFDNGVAIYKNPDGSMMTLEVPKDQYDDVVKLMAKRIKNGQVPNESNPANAAKYVKKSPLTYEQAQIATKSIFDRNSTIKVRDEYGNIVTKNVTFAEKLFYSAGLDFLTGATASMPVGLVSGVWVYCNTRSQGKEPQDALKLAMIATAKPVLIGGTMYMLSSQFAGSAIGKKTGESFAKNILGKTLTNNQRTSMVTKGSMGLMTAAIVVGPDLVDCLRGRISVEQLIKNAVVSGGGMVAGAMAGAALGSVVPGVGTAIGTVVGGAMGATATKAIADEFKVDDSVMMMQIAKEEFIETVMVTPLSQEEFEQILEKTFIHKQFASKLKDMFASGEPKEYIHKEFLDLVTEEFSKRELPDESEIVEMMMVQKELFGLAS
ncbi:hypothetical protein B9P78_00625 [Aerococcus sp. 1KP-2016]|nr:hypothetical protein B9P78_00625 [Aerococcus sp. 1KP-2016]